MKLTFSYISKFLYIIGLLSFSGISVAKEVVKDSANNASHDKSMMSQNRDRLVGNIIKSALEQYHFNKINLDDSLSRKAFEQYLERMDYSRQFLLEQDVKSLQKYKMQMDDQMLSGNLFILNDSVEFLQKRIKAADVQREKAFKKPFDFNKKEKLELDPKKRGWAKTQKDFDDYWFKTFKYQTLNRYLSLKQSQEDDDKEEKEKTKTKTKSKADKKKIKKEILTDDQMRKKAHEAINKKYKRIFARMQQEDHEDHLENFINSITTIYDPHTVYMPPRKKEDFDIDISGKLEGIGAVLQEDGSHIKVVKIVPGGAAWRQKGLAVDDVILYVKPKVNEEMVDLLDMRVDDAVRYIRGPKGSIVELTVKSVDGTRKVIKIERDVVKVEASFAKSSVIHHKKLPIKVGYIHVPKFYRDFGGDDNSRNCTDDVRKELNRLKTKGVDAMILDLRNNGGGALEDAKKMSGLFIKKGPIVQIKDHAKQIDVMTDNDPGVVYDGPLIVMINRFSASASEILAGALQDYGRAIIVGGEYSHGKGTVQAVLPLSVNPIFKMLGRSLGALKVTIQKFYRISGESTQFKGVTPSIILPDPYGHTESREQDLVYALPWDKVAPLNYTPWTKHKFDMPALASKSKVRIDKDERFQKVNKYVSYLKQRRDQTEVSLNLSENIKEDEENKKISEELKNDKANEDIFVSAFEESLKDNLQVKSNDKQWKEDFKRRKEDWLELMQKDPMLEETLYILDDVVKMQQKKISMK